MVQGKKCSIPQGKTYSIAMAVWRREITSGMCVCVLFKVGRSWWREGGGRKGGKSDKILGRK